MGTVWGSLLTVPIPSPPETLHLVWFISKCSGSGLFVFCLILGPGALPLVGGMHLAAGGLYPSVWGFQLGWPLSLTPSKEGPAQTPARVCCSLSGSWGLQSRDTLPHTVPSFQIVVSTGISYGASLKTKFGIAVVGNIPSG